MQPQPPKLLGSLWAGQMLCQCHPQPPSSPMPHGASLTCPTAGCRRPGRAWQGPAGTGCQQGTSSAGRSQGAEREQVSACPLACRTSRLRAHSRSQASASVATQEERCHLLQCPLRSPCIPAPPCPSPKAQVPLEKGQSVARGGSWVSGQTLENERQRKRIWGTQAVTATQLAPWDAKGGCVVPRVPCFGGIPATPLLPSGHPPACRGRAAPRRLAGCSSWGRSATRTRHGSPCGKCPPAGSPSPGGPSPCL